MGVPPPSYQEITDVMIALDQNGDGKLSFEEMKPILKDILQALVDASKAAKVQHEEDEEELCDDCEEDHQKLMQ
jgi:hypothetical protein